MISRNVMLYVCALAGMLAQTPAILDKVSIKPGGSDGGMRYSAGHLEANGKTLRRLVAVAYHFAERRVVGGPSWMDTEAFNVEATSDTRDLTAFDIAIQRLFAERFSLTVHKEKRDSPVYVLKRKEGVEPKLERAAAVRSRVRSDDGFVEASEAPMSVLANHVERYTHRYVVDETGLEGGWNFRLDWAGGTLPALQTAVAKQLGLELVEGTRSIEVLVIDRAEKLKR